MGYFYLQPSGKVAGHNYYGILELSVDFRCQFGVDELRDRYESSEQGAMLESTILLF